MARMRTPTRLIGIGGGGSRVVYRFMQQDWILKEVVADRDQPKDYLKATVIDSAKNDQFHDTGYTDAQSAIDSVLEESNVERGDGHIQFQEPRLLPDMLSDRWENPDQLTAEEAISQLMAYEDLNSWWLEQNKDPLKQIRKTGFGGGVSRRRAVSKALYHIAENEDKDVRPSQVTQANNDFVCMVAALGGGTGSGMVLDIAKELADDVEQLHLFAVLPHANEKQNPRANAYAALSELEYAHLHDENPFETITLLPYQQSLEANPEDFEMAVVRTILAHQNGFQEENLDQDIPPGSNNGPPDFPPFTVAVPNTVLYDIRAREDAKDQLRDFFENKEDELEREYDLYRALAGFFGSAFPNHDKDELLEGEMQLPESCGNQALEFRKRITENLYETLLNQTALEVAGIDETTETIRDAIDTTVEDHITFEDTRTDEGEALRFVNSLRRIRNGIANAEYGDLDEFAERLLDIVDTEFRNAIIRRNLWAATELIESGPNSVLTDDEVRLVRRLVREVILNPDVQYTNTVILEYDDAIEQKEAKRDLLQELRTRIEQRRDETIDSLTPDRSAWRDDVYDYATRLKTIDKYQKIVTNAIDEVIDEVNIALDKLDKKCKTEADTRQVSLSFDFDLPGIDGSGSRKLNDLLGEMGVSPIDFDGGLTSEFDHVKTARGHHLAHNPGLLKSDDRTDSFGITTGKISEYFKIQPDEELTRVDRPWSCKLKESVLKRESEINDAKERAITAIAEDLLRKHLATDGHLPTAEVSLEDEAEDIEVPADLTLDDVQTKLRADINDLLSDTDSRSPTVETQVVETIQNFLTTETLTETTAEERTKSASELYRGYVAPFDDRIAEIDEKLDRFVSEDGRYGVIEILKVLKGLANGPDEAGYDVELPRPRARDTTRETYGDRFAREYEGQYEVEFEREGGSTDIGEHPYLRQEQAEPTDVLGDPDHIGESDVLDNQRDEIARMFSNDLSSLSGGDPRVPVRELAPKGTESNVTGNVNYTGMRFRSVYLSKGYDNHTDLSSKYSAVRTAVGNQSNIGTDDDDPEEPDYYQAMTVYGGAPDEITLVLFIGGVFLDNIGPAVESGGYKEKYESRKRKSEFMGEHHSIGLGGKWTNWPAMQSPAAASEHWPDTGVYVHRGETRDVTDKSFIDEIDQFIDNEDKTSKDLFKQMLTYDTYESSIKRPRPDRPEAND